MTDEIARCEREIAEIEARPDVAAGLAPAWLVTLGVEDWRAEMRRIAAESKIRTAGGGSS